MIGFWSYNRLKSEIKNLRQIYDFTYHLYLQENEIIKEKLSKHSLKEKKLISVTTKIGATSHSLNSLYVYTQTNYPNKLRHLILINLITNLEVYFTNLVREIAERDIEPFKNENEKVEYFRNHLLNFSTIKSIEDDLLNKDIRKLTSGGLEKSEEFFLKRFDINFKNLGIDFKDIEEIHERRHLFVHRNGICDAIYSKTYPAFGFKPGDVICLQHDYIIYALDKILEFAGKINKQCLSKFPDSKRKIKSLKGPKTFITGEVKLLIEFETLKNNFDINSEILNKPLNHRTEIVNDFTLQYIIFEKRIQLYISAGQKELGMILSIVKQNANLLILNKTEIDF